MNNLKVLQNIIEFMKRVNLTGNEVPAFNDCMNYVLDEIETLSKTNEEENGQTKRDS